MMANFSVNEIGKMSEEAYERIKDHILKTPLQKSTYLTHKTGVNVYLKLESEQLTGSFKVRGAFNKVLISSLSEDFQKQKFLTASAGNHGAGLSLALSHVGKKAIVYVPETIDKSKEERLLMQGTEVRKFGTDCVDAEKESQRAAKDEGGIYVSPYNDIDVIAGQGTIAVEVIQELKQVDAIFITAGGGGMIAGIASYMKHVSPHTQVVGCSPAVNNCLELSVKAGRVVEIENIDTLSDASAGNIDQNTITLPICQKSVDRWVAVTEEEIADAVYMMLDVQHKVVEGSAGTALAGFLKTKEDYVGKNIVVVICGCNIATAKLKSVIDSHLK